MKNKVVLLGPQGPAPDIGQALYEHGITGEVALVRAGYQERELEDAAMRATFGVPAVNLELHRRSVELFREDPQFQTAYGARQSRLRHMQAFYRVRLEKIEDAARNVSVRYVDNELLEQEEKVSVDQFRHIDADHIERCEATHKAFDTQWVPGDRPTVARHRAEIKAAMKDCEALVIAGGHVASLVNRLALFDVLASNAGRPIFAWGAGAMVLTDRIVLFHDYPPYGSDIAQVLDAGFGLAPGVVVLPDAKRRVNLDARAGIARFARRMAPLVCVALDNGERLEFADRHIVKANASRLDTSGTVERGWSGAPSRFSTATIKWARE